MKNKKKKNVLMIWPRIPPTYWSLTYAIKYSTKKAVMPPLSLPTIASLLPENYEPKIIDMNIRKLTKKDIQWADLIFVSAMVIQKNSFEAVVRQCNKFNKKIVAGGPYPTSYSEDISGVDHFILGEAELLLKEFIRDYELGKAEKVYESSTKPDIAKNPIPRYDLLEIEKYSSMAIQYSRGCPYKCEFCDIIELFGRKVRAKNPEQFLKEMEYIRDLGHRGVVFIVDDNFIGNKKAVKKLLKEIVEWQKYYDYPFLLFTEVTADLAGDDELLELMVEAGMYAVFIGIETPDMNTLKKIQKLPNLNIDLYEGIKKIQRRGIMVYAGFIVGFDNDREDIFDLQAEFIMKSAVPFAMIGTLTVFKNTQLWRRLNKEKRLKENILTSGNNVDSELNYVPKMPEEIIINGYLRVIAKLYINHKNYFARCLELLKRMPEPEGSRNFSNRSLKVKLLFIRTSVNFIFKNIFTSYIYHFFRFFKGVRKTMPYHFPLAFLLGIWGLHFFKISRDIILNDIKKRNSDKE